MSFKKIVKYIQWSHNIYKIKKSFLSYKNLFGNNNKKTRIYLLKHTDTLDIRKMKTSFTANYIHSLYSESLMRTVSKYIKRTKEKPILTIHDCFMVPVNVLLEGEE